ncbi:hypothetical protein KL936_003774 [Ogataea polymorpha]|nr:hypothetical protein KL936_003774 [Ogataea polymorpha]
MGFLHLGVDWIKVGPADHLPTLISELKLLLVKRAVGATLVGEARIVGRQERRELQMYHVQPEIWDISAFLQNADHLCSKLISVNKCLQNRDRNAA